MLSGEQLCITFIHIFIRFDKKSNRSMDASKGVVKKNSSLKIKFLVPSLMALQRSQKISKLTET